MEISGLTLKLIILLIPGVVAAIILERLTVHKPWDSFRFVLNAILLGAISYLLLQGIIWSLNACGTKNWLPYPTVWESLDKEAILPYWNVGWACIVAIPLGLLVSIGDNNKWLIRFANRLGISDKYGDESLYYNFMGLEETVGVHVRNVGTGVTYTGTVRSFEDLGDTIEMVLDGARVYLTGGTDELYSTQRVYLSLQKAGVIIEYVEPASFPHNPNSHEPADNKPEGHAPEE